MRRLKSQRFGFLLVSFCLAMFLFFYATMTNYQNNNQVRTTTSETYTDTVYNVPVDVNYDSKSYFISGLISSVTVQLTSSNRLTLQKESQEATRSFSVKADFSKFDSGTHEVQLKIENLPSGVTATVSPTTVTARVGRDRKSVV